MIDYLNLIQFNWKNTVNSILNKLRNDYNRGRRTFIIDATPGDLNINFKGKKISKESLEYKDYAWAWGTSIGFYIGYKITLVLDHKTKMPVYFMIDRGSPNDTTMVSKILPILQRKKIIRKGDCILMDRGYYSYENYKNCIAKISCNSINPDKIQIQQRKVRINVKLSVTFISCKIQFKKS